LTHEDTPAPVKNLVKFEPFTARNERSELSSSKHSPFAQVLEDASDARTTNRREAAAILFKAMSQGEMSLRESKV
jgi:hypothetical protein